MLPPSSGYSDWRWAFIYACFAYRQSLHPEDGGSMDLGNCWYPTATLYDVTTQKNSPWIFAAKIPSVPVAWKLSGHGAGMHIIWENNRQRCYWYCTHTATSPGCHRSFKRMNKLRGVALCIWQITDVCEHGSFVGGYREFHRVSTRRNITTGRCPVFLRSWSLLCEHADGYNRRAN